MENKNKPAGLFSLKDKENKRVKCKKCSREVFLGLGSGVFKCCNCGTEYHASQLDFLTWVFIGHQRS